MAVRVAEFMTMTMMQVRIMRVGVGQRNVFVAVGVRFASRVAGCVRVLMMFVVNMTMIVIERVMDVIMFVPFDQMQADADSHEDRGSDQAKRDGLLKDGDGEHRANEGRGRKISPRAGAAEVDRKSVV